MPDPVTALIGGGATILSGYLGSEAVEEAGEVSAKGVERAAELELEGVREGIAYQKGAEERARADIAPWREKGVTALGELEGLIEAGPGEFEVSPGYEFRTAEGLKAIERSAAARGGALSGAALKGITRFGQDYATSDYDNFLRRYYDKLKPYQSLAGIGQTAAGQQAGITTGTGQDISLASIAGGRAAGEGVSGAAGARASGYINQANIMSDMIGSGTSLYTMYQMGKD